MITYVLTLADGTRFTITSKRKPLNWKSQLMQQAPYGTDYVGCLFTRER